METFITDVSTTRTNIAIARSMASLRPPLASSGALVSVSPVIESSPPNRHAPWAGGWRRALRFHRVPPGAAVSVSQTHVRRDARIGNPLETQRCLSGGGTRDSGTRPIALATRGVSVCCMPWRLTVSLGMAYLDEVREGLKLFERQSWASAYAALAEADERAPLACDQLEVLA